MYTCFNPEITICCMKKGNKYDSRYVNKLFNMVQRYTSRPYDFVCFTDNISGIDGHIRTMPLPYDAEKWWCKMGLYKPAIDGVYTENLLFLDLDVVVVGSIDRIISMKSDFAMAKDYPRKSLHPFDRRQKWGNTSVVKLKIGSQTKIWEKYVNDGCPTTSLFGDQEWIYNNFYGCNDIISENLVKSYKLHKLAGNKKPKCSIVMFHGQPKPHECDGWVKDYWL